MKIIEVNPSFREAVEANDGYCPCMIEKSPETKCMCKDFREQREPGKCHCGRFEKVCTVDVPVKIGDTVYGIRRNHTVLTVFPGKVCEMYITESMRLAIHVHGVVRGFWGEKVFRTREDAENYLGRNKHGS